MVRRLCAAQSRMAATRLRDFLGRRVRERSQSSVARRAIRLVDRAFLVNLATRLRNFASEWNIGIAPGLPLPRPLCTSPSEAGPASRTLPRGRTSCRCSTPSPHAGVRVSRAARKWKGTPGSAMTSPALAARKGVWSSPFHVPDAPKPEVVVPVVRIVPVSVGGAQVRRFVVERRTPHAVAARLFRT